MATDLHDLMGGVVFETGQVLDDQEALRLLSESIRAFNVATGSTVTLSAASGAQPTRKFLCSRDLSNEEERILILLAVLLWLDGQARKYSLEAIHHSNPAGTTKLDGIEFAISKRAKEIRDGPLKDLLDLVVGSALMAGSLEGMGHNEMGETLPQTRPSGPWYGWGTWAGWTR